MGSTGESSLFYEGFDDSDMSPLYSPSVSVSVSPFGEMEEAVGKLVELNLHDEPRSKNRNLISPVASTSKRMEEEETDLYGRKPVRTSDGKFSRNSSKVRRVHFEDSEESQPQVSISDSISSSDNSRQRSDSSESTSNGGPSTSPVSRRELLDIVRKHSDSLTRSSSRPDFNSGLMEPRYWREMLDLFFIKGWGLGERSVQFNHNALFDDMLFFVRIQNQEEGSEQGEIDNNGSPILGRKPVFVRHWAHNLGRVVGETTAEVDWRRSFFLNLICHTVYTLTVAVCSREALENHKKSKKGLPVAPIKKITKRVYASPSKARVDCDAPKGKVMASSYPDICFSVDNYEDALESVELNDSDHCLCVLLNAHGGAAFPAEESSTGRQSNFQRKTSTVAQAFGEADDGQPKVTLFSGFVSYSMVRTSFHGGQVGSFGSWGSDSFPPERLVMRGPGGRGEADVTVSCPQEDPQQNSSQGVSSSNNQPTLLELQAELGRVQEDLKRLVEEQQRSSKQSQLTPEKKMENEAKYHQKLKILHTNLNVVQDQLQALQLQEKKAPRPPRYPTNPSRKPIPGGLADFMRRAARYTVAPSGPPPLLCTLRTLSLPWDVLAFDLLFKEMPIKVDITGHILPRLPPKNLEEF